MSLHFEMSPQSQRDREEDLRRLRTPAPTLEQRVEILRRSIEANRDFASPQLIEKWEQQLAELEAEIRKQKPQ